MNNFQEDLNFSHEAENMDMWQTVYSEAFPGFLSMTSTREDGQMQQLGVDRTVVMSSGKAVYIDEKVRRKWYGDILLEYVSNDQKNTQGWVEKPLFCDYIAYAVIPNRFCYLLPVPQLQSAWIKNKEDWLEMYGTKEADNKYYKTLNCPIPLDIIFPALGKTLRIQF